MARQRKKRLSWRCRKISQFRLYQRRVILLNKIHFIRKLGNLHFWLQLRRSVHGIQISQSYSLGCEAPQRFRRQASCKPKIRTLNTQSYRPCKIRGIASWLKRQRGMRGYRAKCCLGFVLARKTYTRISSAINSFGLFSAKMGSKAQSGVLYGVNCSK